MLLKGHERHYITMIHLTICKIVGRSYLKNDYLSSFIQFENCCGICWHCKRLKQILDEFEKRDLIRLIRMLSVGKFNEMLIFLK